MVGKVSSLRVVRDFGFAGLAAIRLLPRQSAPIAFPAPAKRKRSDADLARMIESEIIPRLMLAHGEQADSLQPAAAIDAATLDAFARLTLAREAPILTDYVRGLLQDGMELERIYVELLIPTARKLGEGWDEDEVSFTEVTVGLSRLQQVVRTLGHELAPKQDEGGARSACFVPAPNEQHVFGLFIVEDAFRRNGWRTWLDIGATPRDAALAVRRDWFDLFGLSATSDTPIDAVAELIGDVRAASCNRDLFVMVGGRLFDASPELVHAVGADGWSSSAADALLIADKAVRARV